MHQLTVLPLLTKREQKNEILILCVPLISRQTIVGAVVVVAVVLTVLVVFSAVVVLSAVVVCSSVVVVLGVVDVWRSEIFGISNIDVKGL